MYLKTEGLVLRVSPFQEADAMLSVLTRGHGLLSVRARGLRRAKSPLKGACQLLAYSEFTLFENRGFYTVNEAAALEMFLPLRDDLERLTLAQYFAQVAEVLSQEDAPQSGILPLTLNAIYALTKLNLPQRQIKAVFELRAMCVSGFQPELHGCAVCGAEAPERFDVSEGCLICAGCGGSGIRMPLGRGALAAMRYITLCEPKKIFSFRLEPQALDELADIAEAYLITKLERGFSTLDFYKSLLLL